MINASTILDDVKHEASHLVPAVASVLPFVSLFSDEGEVSYDDDGRACYFLESDHPLPDDPLFMPGMRWSVGIYEDRAEIWRLVPVSETVTRIASRETMSLARFRNLLQRIRLATSAGVSDAGGPGKPKP